MLISGLFFSLDGGIRTLLISYCAGCASAGSQQAQGNAHIPEIGWGTIRGARTEETDFGEKERACKSCYQHLILQGRKFWLQALFKWAYYSVWPWGGSVCQPGVQRCWQTLPPIHVNWDSASCSCMEHRCTPGRHCPLMVVRCITPMLINPYYHFNQTKKKTR